MKEDSPSRTRFRRPKFHHGYTAMMKTLNSSLKFESSNPAKFRLRVLEHASKHGISSACEAFQVGRSTYYDWKQAFTKTSGKLASLVPRSTRPAHTRTMFVDDRLVSLIKSIRQQYGRIGKDKLKVLVSAYADSLGIDGYSAGKIGKIIKRNNYFFDVPKQKHKLRFPRSRVRRVGKDIRPGYVEMDSVIVWGNGVGLRLLTVMDIVTKVAYAKRVKTGSAIHTIEVLKAFEARYHLPIHTVQTDNGSEFLGDFNEYLESRGINHLFIYPRCPRVNGAIERFNRTIQEECVERSDWQFDVFKGDEQLVNYLSWYNTQRPHAALNYLTPQKYAAQYL